MWRNTFLFLFALAVASAGRPGPRGSERGRGHSDHTIREVVPNSYVIEYSQGTLGKRQSEIQSYPGIQIVRTFDSNIFAGVVLETEELDIISLKALPDVLAAWPNYRIYLDEPPLHRDLGELDNIDRFYPHNSTGVSKLHEKGIFGKGAKVGVVDTGISYNHPDLGGGFGEGFKVEGGWDFAGDSEEFEPDDDPDDPQGHGTHVAGIIAADGGFFQGVAPKATLYAYKVYNDNLGVNIDVLLDAFIRAYKDGCDIITASLGMSRGWSTDPWAELASRLVEEGVVVTISAGNAGRMGPFLGETGAAGRNVLAVASVESEIFPLKAFDLTLLEDDEPNTTTVGYMSDGTIPAEVDGWPIIPMISNTSSYGDPCSEIDDDVSFEGKIPLIDLDSCFVIDKQINLAAAGADYILVFNLGLPMAGAQYDPELGIMVEISGDDAKAIIEAISKGGNATADFSSRFDEWVIVENEYGGLPSEFTSWGGLNDLQIKPDIGAPGGQVLSTIPPDGYGIKSGTSMSTPYIAGVAALWIGEHGGRDKHGKGFAKKLHQRIISSGVSLPWTGLLSNNNSEATDYFAPIAQVGTGLVDAVKVLEYDTRLEFDKLALNDTRYFNNNHEITVFNEGKDTVDYTLSVEHGAGVESADWLPTPSELDEDAYAHRIKTLEELEPISLEVSSNLPNTFTLKPGESKKVTVSFQSPENQGWKSDNLPLYSGKVVISSSNGEQLGVPFLGLGADLCQDLDPMTRVYAVSGPENVPITEDSSFSFDLDPEVKDYPVIHQNLFWGTRQVRWDIFEAGWRERQWKYPPVVGENKYLGSAAIWEFGTNWDFFDPEEGHDPEDTISFPLIDMPRDDGRLLETTHYWFGKLANGSQIAEGTYVMRYATLKPFSAPGVSDSWEVYESPEITVTGQY